MRFEGARVMIVEDDLLIARELTLRLEDEGAEIVGPVVSVTGALKLLESAAVDGAILDVTLHRQSVAPVAEWLLSRQVPFLFHTGQGLPPELKSKHPDLPVILKPSSPVKLLDALAKRMNRQAPRR